MCVRVRAWKKLLGHGSRSAGVNILNWTVLNCRAWKRMSAQAREENTATMSIFTYTSRM